MHVITERQWQQITQGIGEQCCGPLEWVNLNQGVDAFREYRQGDQVVARMTVYEANTDKPGNECARKFEAEPWLLDRCKHIYIPTQAELNHWEDAYNELEIDELMRKKTSGEVPWDEDYLP